MAGKRTDNVQEFVDLYVHEETLAFFECELASPQREPIAGLCRISRPKTSDGTAKYVSLMFTFDTPDDNARTAVDAALARIEDDVFKESLRSVSAVVPLPPMARGLDNYVRQLDIMLEAHVDPDKFFIADRLLPAVQKIAHLTAGTLVWWDEAGRVVEAPVGVATSGTQAIPLSDRFREYLRRHLRR